MIRPEPLNPLPRQLSAIRSVMESGRATTLKNTSVARPVSHRNLLITSGLEGFPSGQREQTVNLSA